jgi:hypothetical protein
LQIVGENHGRFQPFDEITRGCGEECGAARRVASRPTASICSAFHAIQQVLSALDISDNKFSEVPPGLSEALDLKLLFISNNQITTLPPFLLDLPQLNRLNITGNPIDKESPDNENLHSKLQFLCTSRGGKFQGLAAI